MSFVRDQNYKSILAEVQSSVVQKHKDLEDSIRELAAR